MDFTINEYNIKNYSKTKVVLCRPFDVKSGSLGIGDDYHGLFLSRKYLMSFPMNFLYKDKSVISENCDTFEDIMLDIMSSNIFLNKIGVMKKIMETENCLRNENIVDFGESFEKQTIEDYLLLNNAKRIETGYVNFGLIDGCYIRGDNLFNMMIDKGDKYKEDEVLWEEMKKLMRWRSIVLM